MKKKILGGIAVFAMAAVVAINVNISVQKGDASLLSLENIEALARGEEFEITCGRTEGFCWRVVAAWGPYCTCEFSGIQSDFCVFV